VHCSKETLINFTQPAEPYGHIKSSHVAQKSQRLEVAPPDWQPIETRDTADEPKEANSHGLHSNGLRNRIILYVVGKYNLMG
jgi:hypothetical protein